jgi:hypothetical protein
VDTEKENLTGKRHLDIALDFTLAQRSDDDGYDCRKERSKFFFVYTCHDRKEEKAALAQTWQVESRALESKLHDGLEIRPKALLADSFGQRPHGVLGDASQGRLVALSLGRRQKWRYELDGLIKVRVEFGLGCVSS